MHRLLLGRDHGHFGDLHTEVVVDGVAVALSAGADAQAPSARFKGNYSNEDGLLVVSEGARLALAVADAHFGHEASHHLLTALAASSPAGGLDAWLAGAAAEPYDGPSETTLVAVVLDRTTGRGEGLSWGDSSAVQVGAGRAAWLNPKVDEYLRADHPVDPRGGMRFSVALRPGELLLLFTDGIDECHYRKPRSSVGAADLVELYGADPLLYARRLAARALNGVRGYPGGEDNLALIVVKG